MALVACGSPQQSGKRGGNGASDDAGTKPSSGKADSGALKCKESSCAEHASCGSDGTGCSCEPGYDGDGETSCTDIDECANNNGGCGVHTTCVNLAGSFRCDCDPGFASDDNQQCKGLCEMALADSQKCGANARCSVQKDGAACSECAAGYTGDGRTCTDHHAECPAPCNGGASSDTNAVCVPKGSAFECQCAKGYDGSPGSCKNIDECAAASDSCDHTLSKCVDTEGGYSCSCKAGYTDNAGTCVDVDECKDDALHNCPKHASCINDVGSYHCGCAAPFTGDDPNGCYCDMSGYWAMRTDLTTCWTARTFMGVVYISPGVSQASIWELDRYTYDGDKIKVETMGCGEDHELDFVSPQFGSSGGRAGETYSTYIPESVFLKLGFERAPDVMAPAIVPGVMYSTPDAASIAGIDLGSDPLNAVWPTDRNSVHDVGQAVPAWIDTDGDGEPGLTLWPRVPSESTQPCVGSCPAHYSYLPARVSSPSGGGALQVDARAACISVATRVIGHTNTDVDTCEHLVGEAIGTKAEGRVQSCRLAPNNKDDFTCTADDWTAAGTSERCTADDLKLLDGQDQSQSGKSTFELVKIGSLGDTPDCAAVRAALPAIVRSGPLDACPF
jgi:hypothetical protein